MKGFLKEWLATIACQHCTDALVRKFVQSQCFYVREDGIVLHDKKTCIGCGYCLYACPFGAPQFPRDGAFGIKGEMDKCIMWQVVLKRQFINEERELLWTKPHSRRKILLCVRQFVVLTLFSRRCY